ncbi:MAG TPA: phage baseplate assembly protein V [Thermoleophilia bacterium]|nr:phage baseplate assembly protein V [Thermoleophilia bacterium]
MQVKPPYVSVMPGEVRQTEWPNGHTHKGIGAILAICPSVAGDQLIGPCLPLGTVGGGAPNRGIFSVPEVGSAVGLLFVGGDTAAPFYLPGWWGCPGGVVETPAAGPSFGGAKPGDPNIVIWETSHWRVVLANTSWDRLRVESKTTPGSFIEIEGATGKMTLETADLNLGSGAATEAAVLGTVFLALFNAHTHNDPVSGVTGVPNSPMVPGTHTSTRVKVL